MAERRKRRRFTTEFEAEAVRRLLDGGKGLGEVAAGAYLAALDLDPLAVSAAERLAELAPGLGSADLAAWARAKAAHLEAMEAARAAPAEETRPYQRYGGVLGRR